MKYFTFYLNNSGIVELIEQINPYVSEHNFCLLWYTGGNKKCYLATKEEKIINVIKKNNELIALDKINYKFLPGSGSSLKWFGNLALVGGVGKNPPL